ncbi:MAG: ABC transporter ATP-binding protein [Opitutales bacterium]|nr:ABC transporter ATP-binding protein [Opitutales bacterium]
MTIEPSNKTNASLVNCREVRKSFGSVEALKGASFEIRKGECFGLLGPNGAGKSTLIRILYGATSRSDGDVDVFGLDPASDARSIKKRLGVVTQDNALDEDMAVGANMMMYARCVGIPRAKRRARVQELLEMMSLAHRADARIRELSGGMQRRLVFVRALLAQPDILVLDEPTTGLDPAVRLHLWEQVQRFKERGSTILLTTHYMDEAERLCDRLVILHEGRVRAEGSPRNLIQRFCPGSIAVLPASEANRVQAKRVTDSDPDFSWFEDRAGVNVRGPSLNAVEAFLERCGLQPVMLRPSNLEDVFLEVTGRELGAND